MLESIKLLAWDSQFFGKRVGQLDISTHMALDNLLQLADQQQYEIVYVYSPVAIEASSARQYSFLDVGGCIVFAQDLRSTRFTRSQPVPEIVEYQHDTLTTELIEIAFLSGHFSRFRIDPSLPMGSFERLYESWLANTLERRPKAAIYTYQTDGRIVGLITAEWCSSKCRIGLLAVLESYQKQGIATNLIRHVRDICIAKEVYSIEVKTQLSNTSAKCLYMKNSFAERDRSFLYHAHSVGWPRRHDSLYQWRS